MRMQGRGRVFIKLYSLICSLKLTWRREEGAEEKELDKLFRHLLVKAACLAVLHQNRHANKQNPDNSGALRILHLCLLPVR